MNWMWLADYRRAKNDTQWIKGSTILGILDLFRTRVFWPGPCDPMDVPQSSLGAPLQTWGKSRSTFVDPTFAANERGKRFRIRFVLRCIPQHARPLGSRALVHLAGIGGAANDRGKRLVGGRQVQMLQL
jgi:hypothetical protein